MNEDKLIVAQAEDKVEQCRNRNYMTNTVFLDLHQQSILRREFRGQHDVQFYGGYPDAERMILVCVPDYMEEPDPELLTVIRASRVSKGGKPLAHRDYLGSLTGLGIKREMTGDILVREDGADIIVLTEIADFILGSYGKAGRVDISVEAVPIDELIIPEQRTVTVTDTVASVRLDNVVSAGFGLSRSKAADAIRAGLVFVDHMEGTKPDLKLEEGALISFRHKGRLRLTEIGGQSRKGRYYISMERY